MTGGGTGGAIAPLLAVSAAIQRRNSAADISFLLTKNPSEWTIVHDAGFSAQSFPAGKWRRYLDLRNIADLFLVGYAFFRSLFILSQQRPDVVVSAGSYLSVPVAWAARCKGIPVLIHQQDVEKGLANRLMEKAASVVTVTFTESAAQFQTHGRVLVTGNPVRETVLHGNLEHGRQRYHLEPDLPVLLVLGGSSGAHYFSTLLEKTITQLVTFCQVIHVTGKRAPAAVLPHPRYHPVAFLAKELADVIAVADLVVTRAGLSTLSELAAIGKPVCIIPMPGTHQEANARVFGSAGAALVFSQLSLTPEHFVSSMRDLLQSAPEREKLSNMIRRFSAPDAATRIAEQILSLAKTS